MTLVTCQYFLPHLNSNFSEPTSCGGGPQRSRCHTVKHTWIDGPIRRREMPGGLSGDLPQLLDPDPLDLVQRDFVTRPVVKLRRAR